MLRSIGELPDIEHAAELDLCREGLRARCRLTHDFFPARRILHGAGSGG